jgi:GTPase SAR1 family protein
MNSKFKQITNKLLKIAEDIEAPDLIGLTNMIKDKIGKDECYIILLGETSSGKSTLINSLINRNLIPVAPPPTTTQVIEISLAQNSSDRFQKIDLENNPKIISIDEFKKLACSSDNDILKLRANLVNNQIFSKNTYILDTPGYNSLISTHSEVFEDFVPQSDVIIYMINYKKGLKQTDLKFIKKVNENIREAKSMHFVVNGKSNTQLDKKIKEINNYLRSNFGYKGKIYLTNHKLIGGKRLLEVSDLWEDTKILLESPDRKRIIYENQRNLLLTLLGKFRLRIQEIKAIDALTFERVIEFEKLINSEEKKWNRAKEIINETYIELNKGAKERINEFSNTLIGKAEQTINDRNKFVEPLFQECTEYLKTHFFPTEINTFSQNLSNYIKERLIDMATKLDELADSSFQNIEGFLGIKGETMNRLKEQTIRFGLEKITEYGAKKYLAKLGGRGGFRAGFVNFAKKGVSKGGKLLHKNIRKQVYDNMGRTLKKIGLSAQKSIGVFIVLVTEIAIYSGKVLLWKHNLLKNLRKTAEEQKQSLLKGIVKGLQESESDNISFAEGTLKKQLKLVKGMLKRGKQDFKVAPEILKKFQKNINEMEEVLK